MAQTSYFPVPLARAVSVTAPARATASPRLFRCMRPPCFLAPTITPNDYDTTYGRRYKKKAGREARPWELEVGSWKLDYPPCRGTCVAVPFRRGSSSQGVGA